jgi:hypothetical protein
LRSVGVKPSFLLTVAKAELRALKNVTLLDDLLTSGVAALEGALVLALAEGRPAGDEGLMVILSVFEGRNNALKAEERHKAPELKVDGGSVEFAGNVTVHGVELLVVAANFFIEDVPDEQLVHVVLINALLELAVGAGMRSITKHWSVGECVGAAGAGEHKKGTTHRQGPRKEQRQRGKRQRESNMQAEIIMECLCAQSLRLAGKHCLGQRSTALWLSTSGFLPYWLPHIWGRHSAMTTPTTDTTKEGYGEHRHAKVNVLVLT